MKDNLSKLNLSKLEFETKLEADGAAILFEKISSDVITPVMAMMKIEQNFPKHHFLFESAENGNNKGRYSVLGLLPDLVWKVEDGKSLINSDFAADEKAFAVQEGDILQNLRNLIKQTEILDYEKYLLPAVGAGVFGFMGYDMIRFMENIPDNNLRDEINIPDAIFMRPQVIVVFDGLFDEATIISSSFGTANFNEAAQRISQIKEILAAPLNASENPQNIKFNFSSNCSEEQYCKMVKKGKKYIEAGDIFQVLPSQRFTSDFDKNLSPFAFYRSLRSVNPSPFLFYLKFDDFVLSGSSPEIMVSLSDNKVTIRPLAGTRKRGANASEDKKIAAGLLADEKELAEHLMLIDLGRHDVGRVSKPGSVKLVKKMEIENYSHVMHISSTVEGVLDEKYDGLDALISGFPAGTVSGAPKIRAMENIEELEEDKRSFYAGCVGYFAANGDMETCITLRSALIKDDKIYLQAGAGVVFDSDPKSEYEECLNKARALVRACEKIS